MAALWQRARQEMLPGVRAPTDPNLSPTPSGDRLSVSIGHGGSTRSSFGSSSAKYSSMGDSSDPATPTDIRGVRFSKDYLAAQPHDEDDDDDYSASIDALLRRRDSKRRGSTRRSPARRVSSPYSIADSERHRRRSSTMTTTSGETQISMEDSEIPEEEIFETIHMHKEVIDSVKKQAWRTRKKLKVIRQAKTYVKKHEGLLEARLAQSKSTKDIMARYNLVFLRYWARLRRELANLAALMVPWEQRIKRIESHFGSVVASYFTFLRWVFWINIVMSILIACFIIIPEVLAADRIGAGDRKELLPNEEGTAFNLQTLWDFEGWLKYSPIFYGYYTNTDKTQEGYRLPFAYFLTSLGVYVYSFWAILQKMAENSRMSKLSEKDDECTFTWKLFTGWDYMIGNSETSQNKVASLVMSFKEAILEEQEKKKEGRNWKIIALRSIANFIIVLLLGSSAYAVVLVVERSQMPEGDSDWWRQNEVTVVVSMIGVLWPNLFEIVGLMENYHPRNQLQWQLSRILMLNMLNLYTLNFALFDKVDKMSMELGSLKPNTTTSAPPTTTTTYQMTPTNATGAWTFPSFNESTVMPRYVNTSAGIFNLTGLDLNCTVVAVDCDLIDGDLFTTVAPLLNFTLPPDLFYINASLLPTVSDFFNWTFGPDINSTLATMMPNFTDFFDFNGTLPMLNESVPFYINTSVSLLVGNATNASSAILPNLEFGVTIHPSLKSMSLVFLPPNMLAKHNLSLEGNVSLANGTDLLPVNTTELGTTLSTLVTDWISEAYLPSLVTEANVTIVVSTTAIPLNKTDKEGFDITSSIPLNFTELFDGTMYPSEAPQCYAIWCPEPPTSDFFPSTFIPFTEMETTTPSPTTFPTTVDPCANDNCTQETTTEEEHRTTPLIVDGYEVDMDTRIKLRKLCWETMFGQELVKLTIMDLVLTIIMTVVTDFIRAVMVRVLNNCCCWDLEKQFPGYGDFKIAENILHLVNNQGMVWMGTFFSPGLPGINMVKLFVLMYVRSWAVLTCNIPHETVFKASGSNNFYYALLLTMLFLCTLPVSYAVVWLEPSWHCGPFSQYSRIYRILTTSVTSVMPGIVNRALDYITSPSIVIPLMILLILIIYYLLSLTQSLREANKDLKNQLRKERTEQKKQVSQMAEARHDGADTPNSKWPAVMKKILPVLPNKAKEGSELETLRQASEESKESGKEDGNKNSKVETVKPYVLSDDESILIETDNETTSITFTDETKQDKRKTRTKSKDIYERERKMSDVPLITISKAKDIEPSDKEKNGKNREKKDKKNKKGRSLDKEEKKSKATDDQTSDSDDQAALIKPDKKKDKDEKTKKDKKSKEKKDKEETEEKGKKDKKGKEKEKDKEKDSKKDKDDKGKKDKDKEEKDKKDKDKKETKKEKEERLKREKEEQKKEKEEKKKREKEEKSKKDKEEKGKKDKEDKKKEKDEKGKKETDEKGKKDKEEKGKKDKDEKGKKEKDEKGKKEKDEKGKKEKDEKEKKEKDEKGKKEKDKSKKEKDSKSKKDKEDKGNKDKEDEEKNEKTDKGKKKENDKQKIDNVDKDGKDDKKKDKEKEGKDKKKKDDRHIQIAEDANQAIEDDQPSPENQKKGTKKSSKRESSEDSSKQEEIEMENMKPQNNEDQLSKQKHLQKTEGVDEEDVDEQSREKQEKMMQDAHLKGDGMFESDMIPLVADSGTPSSISSGRANRVAMLDSSVDAQSLSEEGECDISEVTVLIQDQREPLAEEPDEDTTSLHSEKNVTAEND